MTRTPAWRAGCARGPRIAAETRTPLGLEPVRDLCGRVREELERARRGRLGEPSRHLPVEGVGEAIDPTAIPREPGSESTSKGHQEDDHQDGGGGGRDNDWQVPFAGLEVEAVQRDKEADEDRDDDRERGDPA